MFDSVSAGSSARRKLIWLAVVLLVIGAGYWWYQAGEPARSAKGPPGGKTPPVPVRVETAKVQDLDVFLRGLGTVTAFATVTIRSRVQGQLIEIPFKEGDRVQQGDLLARIDPRPFQVALDQAKGTLAQDMAQYENAKLDLQRYEKLRAQQSIAVQLVDTQRALVAKFEGLIKSDKAAVDNAQLQLDFTRITAPISGRLGLRQVDIGNLLVTNDPQGIVVITQTQPISVVFTLPESELPAVREPVLAGKTLRVDAYDRTDSRLLAQGKLLTADNQIDVATGTFKLKAEFTNEGDALFPNQFVNVRILVKTVSNALTVPSAAIQQGSQGAFLYVVTAEGTAVVRPVKIGARSGDRSQILEGIAPGDRVVLEGTDRLRSGASVRAIGDSGSASAGGSGDGARNRAGAAAGADVTADRKSTVPSAGPARQP
jgi:multidrug efflux system membrane fusion protein